MVALFVTSTGLALASWKVENDTTKQVVMARVTGKIVETYEHGQLVYPMETLDHIMQVQNTGTVDSLVRVQMEKVWGEKQDANHIMVPDTSLDTDNIQINYNTEDWYWNENDGYFYYKGVLKPTELTTPLFETIFVDGEKTDLKYANKSIDITANMEMVQAAYNGASYWNMSLDALGVTYTEDIAPVVYASAMFAGPTKGFAFSLDANNIFINMENIVPGETRSQRIDVKNNWDKKTAMFLRAEIKDEDQLNEETAALAKKMLSQYTTMTITTDNGSVVYSGPVWSIDSDKQYGFSLGEFAANETKFLNVSISMSNQIDNDYRDLLSKVRWVFSAEGEDATVTIPETGENAKFIVWIASGIALILLLTLSKRRQKA